MLSLLGEPLRPRRRTVAIILAAMLVQMAMSLAAPRQVQPPRPPRGFTDNPAYSVPAYRPIGPISCLSLRPVALVASQPTKKIG